MPHEKLRRVPCPPPWFALAPLVLALAPLAPRAAGEPQAESARPVAFELVESFPCETVLDHPGIRDAAVVWPEMIAGARRSLDFGEFYASSAPGSRLEATIAAIEGAAARGVRVRFLVDARFAKTYPADLERLRKIPGLALRVLDLSASTRGVLHAKYFVVDGEELYVGSQNFDWRSLEHIQELGARVVHPEIARAASDAFAIDWAIAGGEPRPAAPRPYAFPVEIGSGEAALKVGLSVAPEPLLADPATYELPQLVALIDGAKTRVRVQVMTYRTQGRDKVFFDALESALRRAAARGVAVELLCADWSKRKGTIEGLQSLEPLENVEVRLTTIPQWSGGFVPYARVCHAKYLVVDGARAWIGTSNWERDYFTASRNLGLVIEGPSVAAELDGFFLSTWNSPYAAPVDPAAKYEAPKYGDR